MLPLRIVFRDVAEKRRLFGDVRAISPRGAIGLMQIMPETWAGLRQRYGLGADPYDAHDNIIAGAAYLRELHDRYGIPGFLAAYNAGPSRVVTWSAKRGVDDPEVFVERIPFNETRDYVRAIMRGRDVYAALNGL